jgi:hypothetical protein
VEKATEPLAADLAASSAWRALTGAQAARQQSDLFGDREARAATMDLARIRDDARRTSTENLLDCVTVYRAEMESPAMAIIESELTARGVGSEEVEAHAAMREKDGLSRRPDGSGEIGVSSSFLADMTDAGAEGRSGKMN